MPGGVRVGRPNRIRHIPLSWDVAKARSNHQPKFRPVGDAVLRGRERTVGQVMEEMFAAMPSPESWITGRMTEGRYLVEAQKVAEPYVTRIAEILQPTFNEGALLGQDRIRASMNEQLRRRGSPLRLTDADGKVTKATANPQTVGGVRVGRSPKAEWAAVGVEAFDSVNTASVDYAKFRSGTLVTNMLEEQQRVIRDLIGESFTAQQTFQTGRTVTGLTAQQTSKALVDVLQEMSPRTSISQNLATFRGVNATGLTHPWERAVYHRAESMATALSKQGVTGRAAYTKIQKDSQRYANKLRRSRARMISRTEIKRAQVQGQLSAMRQAVNDGLADPRTAGKKWVTGATDVCSMCSDLGFGKPILLDQSFHGVGDGPPAHPNCRCDLDFSHTLSSAPKAVGAGDPNFPAGTQQNPMVWQFPSGFQTQPSVTTTFKPPGFIPPPTIPVTPPSPSVPVPSAPASRPQAAYEEPVVPARPAKRPPAGASTMETPQPAAFVDDIEGMAAAVADDAAAQGIRAPAEFRWENDAVTEVYGPGRIPSGQTHAGRNNRLKAGRRVQGFDNKPMRATNAQLDDLVEQGGTTMFRGEETAQYMDELLDGDYYPGKGMFGDGTYFDALVAGEDEARQLAEHLHTAIGYANGETGQVTRGVLKANSRVVSHDRIQEIQGAVRMVTEAADEIARALEKALTGDGMTVYLREQVDAIADAARRYGIQSGGRWGGVEQVLSDDVAKFLSDLLDEALGVGSVDDVAALQSRSGYIKSMVDDEGAAATLFGYDAIQADYGYTVVLNRDAVVFADHVMTREQAQDVVYQWRKSMEATGVVESPTATIESVLGLG